MRKLLGGQSPKYISLILFSISGTTDKPSAVYILYFGIMPRCDIVTAEGERLAEQGAKLYILIALNTGVGRSACILFIFKDFYNLLPEKLPFIKNEMLCTQFLADLFGRSNLG